MVEGLSWALTVVGALTLTLTLSLREREQPLDSFLKFEYLGAEAAIILP